jgi:hypothetical protein
MGHYLCRDDDRDRHSYWNPYSFAEVLHSGNIFDRLEGVMLLEVP